MICIEKVTKIFGLPPKQVRALNDINFRVNEGEYIVVRGPSGSGKTTLLLSVGGMLQPSSGIIKIENRDIYSMNYHERTRFRAENIGFVFQMFYLIPYLNVIENIMLSPEVDKAKIKKGKAIKLAEQVGLENRFLHKPSELSTGERQRVALARALIHRPKIILADEPTGNLDPENSKEVVNILKDYNQAGGTVVFITHRNDTDNYADRILYINKGEIA